MKIEGCFEYKKINQMKVGDLFLYNGHIYILTDMKADNIDMCICIRLESGVSDLLSKYTVASVVEDVTLKIGGYYNHG